VSVSDANGSVSAQEQRNGRQHQHRQHQPSPSHVNRRLASQGKLGPSGLAGRGEDDEGGKGRKCLILCRPAKRLQPLNLQPAPGRGRQQQGDWGGPGARRQLRHPLATCGRSCPVSTPFHPARPATRAHLTTSFHLLSELLPLDNYLDPESRWRRWGRWRGPASLSWKPPSCTCHAMCPEASGRLTTGSSHPHDPTNDDSIASRRPQTSRCPTPPPSCALQTISKTASHGSPAASPSVCSRHPSASRPDRVASASQFGEPCQSGDHLLQQQRGPEEMTRFGRPWPASQGLGFVRRRRSSSSSGLVLCRSSLVSGG